jgi:hypothetical protein
MARLKRRRNQFPLVPMCCTITGEESVADRELHDGAYPWRRCLLECVGLVNEGRTHEITAIEQHNAQWA